MYDVLFPDFRRSRHKYEVGDAALFYYGGHLRFGVFCYCVFLRIRYCAGCLVLLRSCFCAAAFRLAAGVYLAGKQGLGSFCKAFVLLSPACIYGVYCCSADMSLLVFLAEFVAE
jgi:hypothetical protein